ncbi:MAG: 50S ribosomal protein L10 [Pseudomonadota bacterium]
MDRVQKQELVGELNQVFTQQSVIVVTRYSGMSVGEMTDLRQQLREAGAGFKVTKNRLTKLALDGTDAAGIADLFTGPTAIGFSGDPVAAPKVLVKYAKDNEKIEILGGTMGTQVLDAKGIAALAELPSLDELRAKLLGMLNTPATRMASVTAAPATQLARVLNAYAESDAAA